MTYLDSSRTALPYQVQGIAAIKSNKGRTIKLKATMNIQLDPPERIITVNHALGEASTFKNMIHYGVANPNVTLIRELGCFWH